MNKICINCRSYRQKEHWSKGQRSGYCVDYELASCVKRGYEVDGKRYAEVTKNGSCKRFVIQESN